MPERRRPISHRTRKRFKLQVWHLNAQSALQKVVVGLMREHSITGSIFSLFVESDMGGKADIDQICQFRRTTFEDVRIQTCCNV